MKKWMPPNRIRYAIWVLPICLLTGIMAFLLWVPPSKSSGPQTILIKKGTSLSKIAETLKQEGLIRSRPFFLLLTAALGKRTEIKAGEYELAASMPPLEILDHLIKGQVKHHLVTIPEGSTVSQIAELLDALGIVEKGTFLQKAESPFLIAALGLSDLATSSLEGFLFPETYHLVKEMDAEEIIRRMVQQFKKVFLSPEAWTKARELGITLKEAVILASIIEKETPLAAEKPLVSAVFHNRLRRRMPLQSDPTVIYGIKDFDGNLTRAHLMKPTPYNTYVSQGLPPTPICNPGKESLLAALNPAPVPYLYFVSRNNGSHFFSSDLENHNTAVWKYQKSAKRNPLTKK